MRLLAVVLLAVLVGADGVAAQEVPPPEAPGLRAGSIRSSGQTVPNPATLPNAQRSTVDRPVESKDRGRTDYGVCKGC